MICALLALVLSSCAGKTGNQYLETSQSGFDKPISHYQINIEECLKNEGSGTIRLSELFADEVEYIPLGTDSASLIGGKHFGYRTLVTPSRIVADMKVFNRADGKYIHNLSQSGVGPGEFSHMVVSIAADEKRQEFYFIDLSGDLFVYDYNCCFKYKFSAKSVDEVYSLGEGRLLIPRKVTLDKDYFEYFIFDVDTREIIYTHLSSAVTSAKDMSKVEGIMSRENSLGKYVSIDNQNRFWKFKDQWYYYEYLTDSVFALNKEYKPIPVGKIDWKSLKPTKEELEKPFREQKKWNLWGVIETSQFVAISMSIQDDFYQIYFDKKAQIGKTYPTGLHVYKNGLYAEDLYIDDLSFGTNKLPLSIKDDDDSYYKVEQASDILESISANKEVNVSDATLQRLKSLKEDDNEVIVVFKVK